MDEPPVAFGSSRTLGVPGIPFCFLVHFARIYWHDVAKKLEQDTVSKATRRILFLMHAETATEHSRNIQHNGPFGLRTHAKDVSSLALLQA